jgi:hypothetical protein
MMTCALRPLEKLSIKHIGCRSIVSKSAAATAPLVTFKYNTGADPQFRAVYNRGITSDIVESIWYVLMLDCAVRCDLAL